MVRTQGFHPCNQSSILCGVTVTGGMSERFKVPVLKAGVGEISPGVQIPLPPLVN